MRAVINEATCRCVRTLPERPQLVGKNLGPRRTQQIVHFLLHGLALRAYAVSIAAHDAGLPPLVEHRLGHQLLAPVRFVLRDLPQVTRTSATVRAQRSATVSTLVGRMMRRCVDRSVQKACKEVTASPFRVGGEAACTTVRERRNTSGNNAITTQSRVFRQTARDSTASLQNVIDKSVSFRVQSPRTQALSGHTAFGC